MKCLSKFKKTYRSQSRFEMINDQMVFMTTIKTDYSPHNEFNAVTARKELNNKIAAFLYKQTGGDPSNCTLFVRVEPELTYDIHGMTRKKLWCARARLGVYNPDMKTVIIGEGNIDESV